MSSEPQVVGSIASRSVEPGTRQTADRAVKLLRHQATYAPPPPGLAAEMASGSRGNCVSSLNRLGNLRHLPLST